MKILDQYHTPGGGRIELVQENERLCCNVYNRFGEHRIRQYHLARYWFNRIRRLCLARSN